MLYHPSITMFLVVPHDLNNNVEEDAFKTTHYVMFLLRGVQKFGHKEESASDGTRRIYFARVS